MGLSGVCCLMKLNLKSLPAGILGIALVFGATALSVSAQEASSSTTTTTTTSPAVPVAPPAPVTPPMVTQQTTSTTTVPVETLHLRTSYHGSITAGIQLYLRPSGKVYDADGDYVAHLANLDGDTVRDIPDSGDYKLTTPGGHVIASTVVTTAYDSGRTIQLGREDVDGTVASRTTTVTRTTTTSTQ